jgi:hypothetical protein
VDEEELRACGRADQAAPAFAATFAFAVASVGECRARKNEGDEHQHQNWCSELAGAPQTARTEIRSSRESIVAALTVPRGPSASPKVMLVARVSPAM